MQRHTHTITAVFLVGGVLLLAHPATVFAQNAGSAYSGLGETIIQFASLLAAINTFMHIMLLTILKMLGYLLQADFFNDDKMMSALNTIWQLSRNIMNVLFAIALIGVSFYTIITAKTQLIKDKFAHFVIAVILVNFSWFFPRVIIDAANVLTATIYNIPNTLPGYACEEIDENGRTKPCTVVMNAGFFLSPQEQIDFCTANNATVGSPECPCISGLGCYAKKEWTVARTEMRPAHAMVNGLAVSFAKITNYAEIPNAINTAAGGGNNPARVTMQIVISVIMAFLVQIAVLLPLLGLGVGLFLRIVIMWITVAFMPFTFIGFMVNGKLGTNVFGFEVDVWKEFINAAFLPAIVAVPFAIGFIMLGTVASIPPPPGFDTFFVPLIPGVKGWWALMWIFASIGIIWVGAFSALKKSQLVGNVTSKIQSFGQQAFGTAAKLPLLAPLPFPGAGKKGAAVGDLLSGPRQFRDVVNAATRRGMTYQEMLASIQSNNQNNQQGAPMPPVSANADKIVNKMNESNGNEQRIIERLDELKRALSDDTKTEADRVQIVNTLRTELNLENEMDQRTFTDALMELQNKNVDNRIDNLLADTKTELTRIRNLPQP